MGRRWGGGEGLDRGGGMGMMLGRWMVGGRFSFFRGEDRDVVWRRRV